MNSCEFCDKIYKNKYILKRHLKDSHGIIQNESNLLEYVFETKQDFMQWKSEMELETLSSYTSQRVNTTSRGKNHYYECSRSGTYKPAGEGKRRLKSQSSSKTGVRCPSRIVVNEREKLFVKFFNKHEFHEIELQHLRLPKTTRESVAGKLEEGVSMRRILDDIREESISTKTLNRASLITTKDLRNIKYRCNIKNRRHKLDSVSDTMWIDDMESSDSNPVLHYKENCEHSDSNPDLYYKVNGKHIHACALPNDHKAINSKDEASKKKEVTNKIEQLPIFQNQSEGNGELIDLAHQLIEALSKGVYNEQSKSDMDKKLRKLISQAHESDHNHSKLIIKPNLKRKIDKQLTLFYTKNNNTKTSFLKNPTYQEDSIREGLLYGQEIINIHTDFD